MSREKIEQKKQEIEKWLNIQIAGRLVIEQNRTFKDDIMVADAIEHRIHIYSGLDILAFYLGAVVTYCPNWYEGEGQKYFIYKGFKVFEIYNVEDN